MWKNKSEEKLGLKEAKMPKKPRHGADWIYPDLGVGTDLGQVPQQPGQQAPLPSQQSLPSLYWSGTTTQQSESAGWSCLLKSTRVVLGSQEWPSTASFATLHPPCALNHKPSVLEAPRGPSQLSPRRYICSNGYQALNHFLSKPKQPNCRTKSFVGLFLAVLASGALNSKGWPGIHLSLLLRTERW